MPLMQKWVLGGPSKNASYVDHVYIMQESVLCGPCILYAIMQFMWTMYTLYNNAIYVNHV